MSKINAIRLINLNYNNDSIRIADETFRMNGENTFQSRSEIDAVGLVTIFRHLSKTDNEKHHKDDNTDC